ncbi:MAG: TlyA family rRNA (cytidine-2'-O)-methyltransferase, partial [Acidimicrobiales bacterium]
FEAGRAEASKGRGIITDPSIWRRVLGEVIASAAENGAGLAGLAPSPITGSAGNVEFVAWLRRGRPSIPGSERAIEVAISQAEAGVR